MEQVTALMARQAAFEARVTCALARLKGGLATVSDSVQSPKAKKAVAQALSSGF